jgi:AraC-like DNA-binding protein
VRSISRELGISERQLRRRFHAAVGYGPMTLARVLRFQRMLGLARERRRGNLGHLALEAGYADQAHMTSECTRLAGMPPARLLTQRYLLETGPAPDRGGVRAPVGPQTPRRGGRVETASLIDGARGPDPRAAGHAG